MNVQLNSLTDTRKTLVISLSAEEVATEHKAVVGEFVRQARLPGFRPGKAPAAMIERRFAKEIAGELQQKVVSRAYETGREQEKLDVLSLVNVEPGEIKLGAEATVTVTVDVRPEFALPEYTGIEVKVPANEVSAEEVEEVIERLRGERAEFKPAERASQKSDYVKLAYEGTVEGQAIVELVPEKQIYGKVPQTWVEVESEEDGIIPGLGNHISGLKAGEKKTVEIEFPAEFATAPALAGKKASYAIEILEIRERILPEIDEAFLKSCGGVESLDELKSQVSKDMAEEKDRRIQSSKRAQVMEALAAKLSFEPPESLVEGETQQVLRQVMSENLRRGVSPETFEQNKEELYAKARETAVRNVKLQLALARIAEAEKVTVENEDMQRYVINRAMQTQQSPDKVVQELTKDRAAVRDLQQRILFDKAVDLIVSKATVTTFSAEEAAAVAAAKS
ncbi:trigger factor [Cephaloticoccus primus]|uniref:Trigger factor n=1 Tax=Cephaloticoccus primus TaxID=1548207 RepID=A0A139SPY2_9BACT|nr:trigger factor [Cephaloticoccus primus]KXU36574.1 trigger factor [Cephaloticoccus primus]